MKSLSELGMVARDQNLHDFTKAAMLIMRTRGSMSQAAQIAAQTRGSERLVSALKAATPAQTLQSSGADFRVLTQAFIQSLTSQGAFDAVRTSGAIQMPLDNLELRISSSVMVGSTVAEGAWRPLSPVNISAAEMVRAWAVAIQPSPMSFSASRQTPSAYSKLNCAAPRLPPPTPHF